MSNFQERHLPIILKDEEWLIKQRIAGKTVAGILKTIRELLTSKTPNLNLLDLEAEADQQLAAAHCLPTFKGYKGFPSSICLSVNKQLVHGIPKNYLIQNGDVVKFDLGATFEGVIADAAETAIYGEPKSFQHIQLLETCKKSLEQAIQSVSVGKQLGCIGYAIHRYVTKSSRFGIINNYGGHGININQPHAPPFVFNKTNFNEGPRIQTGLTIAIEPMLTIGEAKTKLDEDGWTVWTPDINAHFEHSIYVHSDRVEIITQ